ncbi:hypothetical protein P5V15_007273 [Pogonomyrmex californicus]
MRTVIITVTSGILAIEVAWHLYKLYKRSRREVNVKVNVSNGDTKLFCKNTRTKTNIFEVMFFSKDSSLCRSHLGYMTSCEKVNCPVRHLRKIIKYLDSATDTLDACVYFFTFPELAEAIIKAKERNVTVRIILDESMSQNDTSQIMNFYKEGIKLKSKRLDVLMHHKFVIINNNILITGSVNWTKSAFFGNFENLMVTNEPALVKPFVEEFEKIWTTLSNITTETDFRDLNATI